MSHAKVMTFSEISKLLQNFLNFFFKKKEGVFAPYNFAARFPPSLLPYKKRKTDAHDKIKIYL